MSFENLFDGIDAVVAEPLKFKAKLAIGEDAYTTLKLKNSLSGFLDAMGAATAASAVAKSSAVASTFFAPTGFLGAIGIGTAATPIGWIIAAGVVSGGVWIGMSKYMKKTTSGRVTVIPEFINTPIDILGLSLFELTVPLLLFVAKSDGNFDSKERDLIMRYFIGQWGYDEVFTERGIQFAEDHSPDTSVYHIAAALADYQKKNPDCNYQQMTKEVIEFLEDVIESDGRVTTEERDAIDDIRRAFNDVGESIVTKKAKHGLRNVKNTAGKVFSGAAKLRHKKIR